MFYVQILIYRNKYSHILLYHLQARHIPRKVIKLLFTTQVRHCQHGAQQYIFLSFIIRLLPPADFSPETECVVSCLQYLLYPCLLVRHIQLQQGCIVIHAVCLGTTNAANSFKLAHTVNKSTALAYVGFNRLQCYQLCQAATTLPVVALFNKLEAALGQLFPHWPIAQPNIGATLSSLTYSPAQHLGNSFPTGL